MANPRAMPGGLAFLGWNVEDLDLFLETLFGGQEGFVYAPVKSQAGIWHQQFFSWPGEATSVKGWVQTAAIEADVYISPSLYREKAARKEFVLGAQVVWVEFDGEEQVDTSLLPAPTLRVQTSTEHHQHIYWKIPYSPLQVVEDINRRLMFFLEADSSGWDATQVLRPPGTTNYKRGKQLPVTLLAHGPVGTVFQPAVFDFVPAAPPQIVLENIESLPDPQDVLASHSFNKYTLELFKAQALPKMRSTYLMHLGYTLAEQGLDHSEIMSLLLVADERVGKFYGRADRLLRLAEIASKAINKYSSTTATPIYSFTEFLNLNIQFESHWGRFLPIGGNLIMAGEPSSGKTQISLQAATNFALNKDFLNEAVNCKGPLIFFSMEMPTVGLLEFARRQVQLVPPDLRSKLGQNLFVASPGVGIPDKELVSLIEEHKPVGVFFDSLSSITKGRMSDEEVALAMAKWDGELRKEYGLFTWYIHHVRKPQTQQRGGFNQADLYGSYLYSAKWDTALVLQKLKDQNLSLSTIKVRYAEETKMFLTRSKETLTYERNDKPGIKTVNVTSHPTSQSTSSPPESPGTAELGLG